MKTIIAITVQWAGFVGTNPSGDWVSTMSLVLLIALTFMQIEGEPEPVRREAKKKHKCRLYRLHRNGMDWIEVER